MNDDQTIYARASGTGNAGISVFRISGVDATHVIKDLCEPTRMPEPRNASLRMFRNPLTGEPIDRVLVLFFQGPHSFTGEDVVELHTHGGRAVAHAVSEILQSLPRFRIAEPGEFTRRAFENGKLDLTEAEAVADLVHAETEAQRKQALRQLEGALSALYSDWRIRLAHGLAHLEAAIDFSDEELPDDLIDKQLTVLKTLREEIQSHLDDKNRGERVRDGFTIAIAGPPNAGKSSLLNALAGRDAAIVSPVAGTTRDIIEVHLDIGGYAVTLADTAGLRESTDAVESEGIRRAQAHVEKADLKLLVFDGSTWPHRDPVTQALIDNNTIVIVNKGDLLDKESRTAGDHLFVSAQNEEGLDLLLQRIAQRVHVQMSSAGPPPLTRARHRQALELCVSHLERALKATLPDMQAEDVRLSMRALGSITGQVDVENLLDIIFRDFCIGK